MGNIDEIKMSGPILTKLMETITDVSDVVKQMKNLWLSETVIVSK